MDTNHTNACDHEFLAMPSNFTSFLCHLQKDSPTTIIISVSNTGMLFAIVIKSFKELPTKYHTSEKKHF